MWGEIGFCMGQGGGKGEEGEEDGFESEHFEGVVGLEGC